jgi:phosphonoacetaldehyde hydrolase
MKMSAPAHIPPQCSIDAVVFDWAGTVVDHGSWAPIIAFLDVFHNFGVELEVEKVRRFMGMAKREHIRLVLGLDEVRDHWLRRHNRLPDEKDVDQMYRDFLELQLEVIPQHSAVIGGVPEAVQELLDMGIRIGSTTGYPREVMEALIPLAARGGFSPEQVVTASEVPQGRPAPWMIMRNAEAMGIYPLSRIAVVDDTEAGIEAGRNAGCWTIGVSRTGNLLGLGAHELAELTAAERLRRIGAAERALISAGAHAVVESVADLPVALRKRSGTQVPIA